MIRPEELWQALDALALERGLTPSGLARAAGLDATTFNPSRRVGADGALRWPAMSSLLRALAVLQTPLGVFATQLEGGLGMTEGLQTARRTRSLPLSRLKGYGLFDFSGHPTGMEWEDAILPGAVPQGAYAVRVDTDRLEPVMRDGSSLIVMPDLHLRWSDRVVMCRPDAGAVVGLWDGLEPPGVVPFDQVSPVSEGVPYASVADPSDPDQKADGAVSVDRRILVPQGAEGVWVHRIIMVTV
ncbi:helix-turn-helix transcriptional regulator [Acetobacter indonesiensis]|uniref:helix-turn-helix transcriptional regulator n=1 Tax=Acetobacter indonesiensis TaxID=104101 RepID=UPI0039EB3CCE